MNLENIYRLDYPIYAQDAADDARPISYDPTCWFEEQPLGLFFKFSSLSKGLFVYIDNDAEQICYEVRAADILTETPDYFGFFSPVVDTSDLSSLINSTLQEISFGYADRASPDSPLLFGIKLKFGRWSNLGGFPYLGR